MRSVEADLELVSTDSYDIAAEESYKMVRLLVKSPIGCLLAYYK